LAAIAIFSLSCLSPAWAEPTPATDTQAGAISQAIAYVLGQMQDGHLESAFGAESTTADAVVALAATSDTSANDAVGAMADYLQDRALDYATSAEASLKLALVAEVIHADIRDFGGVDLLGGVQDGIGEDGAFGAAPTPYSAGLALIALHRAGAAGEPLASWLLEQQGEDGGWSYAPGSASDPDNTALATLALLSQLDEPAQAAALRGLAWLRAGQEADGHWEGYSPVNSTAVALLALNQSHEDQAAAAKAAGWLAGAQLPDGGFPNTLGDPESELNATLQALLALTGENYLTAEQKTAATQSPDACPGVWVVVDPGDLGGEPQTGCATEYDTGYAALASAGFAVELTGQGMLCRVNGLPDACVTAANAYWNYWHARPTGSGYSDWEYALEGGGSYQPSAGSVEGWRFGDGSSSLALTPAEAVAAFDSSAAPSPNSGPGNGNLGWTVAVGAIVVAGAAVLVVALRRRGGRV
jgi:hypothetical protein